MKIKYLCNADGTTWSGEEGTHRMLIRTRDALLNNKRFSRYVVNVANGDVVTETTLDDGSTAPTGVEWKHHDYYRIDNEWLPVKEINALKDMGVKVTKIDVICMEADSSWPVRIGGAVFIAWNILMAIYFVKEALV